MTQGSSHEGLQEQLDALAARLTRGEADRKALHDRVDAANSRADLDREMILDLQSEGLLAAKRAADMEQALKSSRIIGAAIGIIMESRNVGQDAAFAILRQASQDSNRKIREIAEDLVGATDVERN